MPSKVLETLLFFSSAVSRVTSFQSPSYCAQVTSSSCRALPVGVHTTGFHVYSREHCRRILTRVLLSLGGRGHRMHDICTLHGSTSMCGRCFRAALTLALRKGKALVICSGSLAQQSRLFTA